jgi:hypothetical protein
MNPDHREEQPPHQQQAPQAEEPLQGQRDASRPSSSGAAHATSPAAGRDSDPMIEADEVSSPHPKYFHAPQSRPSLSAACRLTTFRPQDDRMFADADSTLGDDV